MKEMFIRGESGSQVSSWSPSTNTLGYSDGSPASFLVPGGLKLQQTKNAGDTTVIIPAGITFVYAIAVGGGGGGNASGSGGAGGVAWGWTLANSTCIVGTGGNNGIGNYTRYGNIIAGGGGNI
jgi:hypothetical protein